MKDSTNFTNPNKSYKLCKGDSCSNEGNFQYRSKNDGSIFYLCNECCDLYLDQIEPISLDDPLHTVSKKKQVKIEIKRADQMIVPQNHNHSSQSKVISMTLNQKPSESNSSGIITVHHFYYPTRDLHYQIFKSEHDIAAEIYQLLKWSKGYHEQAQFLLYRIPLWNYPVKRKSSSFKIRLADLSNQIKKDLINLEQEKAKHVLKEAVSMVFESLGYVQLNYFTSRVADQLEVELV